jgi:hypothetical protein
MQFLSTPKTSRPSFSACRSADSCCLCSYSFATVLVMAGNAAGACFRMWSKDKHTTCMLPAEVTQAVANRFGWHLSGSHI